MKIIQVLAIILLGFGFSSYDLSAQSKNHKNAAELNIHYFRPEILDRSGYGGYGGSVKYKRLVYSDEVNNFSIGLLYQDFKPNITYRDRNPIFGTLQYSLRSSQERNGFGLVLSDRFSFKSDKMVRFFFDVELSGVYYYSIKQETYVDDLVSSVHVSESLDAEDDFVFNKFVSYFAIQPGLEFHFHKNVCLYIGVGLGQNINSMIDKSRISEIIPARGNYNMAFRSLIFGIKI